MSVLHHHNIAGLALLRLQSSSNVLHNYIPRFKVNNPSFDTRIGIKCSTLLPSALPNSGSHASPVSSFSQLIEALISGVDLSEAEAESSLDFLLDGADEALISAFLVLLRAKGETYEEVVGLSRAMIKHCRQVEGLTDAVDIVGTGGDGANTVNISTGASILAAASDAKVAKQGNRSSSSACGSADVLETLGVAISLEPELDPVLYPQMEVTKSPSVFLGVSPKVCSTRYLTFTTCTAAQSLCVKSTLSQKPNAPNITLRFKSPISPLFYGANPVKIGHSSTTLVDNPRGKSPLCSPIYFKGAKSSLVTAAACSRDGAQNPLDSEARKDGTGTFWDELQPEYKLILGALVIKALLPLVPHISKVWNAGWIAFSSLAKGGPVSPEPVHIVDGVARTLLTMAPTWPVNIRAGITTTNIVCIGGTIHHNARGCLGDVILALGLTGAVVWAVYMYARKQEYI